MTIFIFQAGSGAVQPINIHNDAHQKLILFSLGNAISGPPTNKGNKKLPLEIGHASRQYPLKEPCMRIPRTRLTRSHYPFDMDHSIS